MTNRAALILSGGNAKRFQIQNQVWRDKALAKIKDKPLLVHVIEKLQDTVDTIAVCINDEQRLTQYRQLLKQHAIENIQFVVDQKHSPIKGPLLAIASGLKAVDAKYCLVVPTDMPFLNPKVADYLLNACKGYDVAVPMWPDGTVETLLMALERENCIEITQTLTALGRANADGIPRAAAKLHLVSPLKEILSLDPELRSFININSQEDLASLKTRSTDGPVRDDVHFDRGELPVTQLQHLRKAQNMLLEGNCLEAQNVFANCAFSFEASNSYFLAGVSEEKLAEAQLGRSKKTIAKQTFARAAANYAKEAIVYTVKGCKLLAERALADKTFCEEKTGV